MFNSRKIHLQALIVAVLMIGTLVYWGWKALMGMVAG